MACGGNARVIPLRDQEAIRQRFEQELKGRVRIDYFTQRPSRIVIPGRSDCVHCEDVRAMLEEISRLSGRIDLRIRDLAGEPAIAAELGIDKVPGIVVRGQANRPVRYAGIPAGNEFPGFIDTIIDASSGAVTLKAESVRQLRKLKDDVRLQVFVSPMCPHSPQTARLAFKLALQSSRVWVEVVEVVEFPALVEGLGIEVTPSTVINDTLVLPGAQDEASLLAAIFKVLEGKALSASEFKPRPATPVQVQRPQQRQGLQATPSGIILPR